MAAFVYREGDVVPPDVTRAIVHSSVRVLPPKTFFDCRRLEEVQLNEGLEEIGEKAFHGCWLLRRLVCPSTLVRIGHRAFMGCTALKEVQLNEGLEEIGRLAFYNCAWLRRLNFPSTLVRIGADAFGSCRLSVVELAGIVNVERDAFRRCKKLSSVELSGILNVERGAFSGCRSLGRIGTPSRAFVVEHVTHGNYACRLVTDGSIAPTIAEFGLIAPECLTALPESNPTELGNSIITIVPEYNLTELGNSIGAIMNNGEGMVEDRLGRVCQVVRKVVRGQVSAILGLAFWKAKIDEAERALMDAVNNHRENTGGGKRAKVEVVLTREARDGCRGEGKGKLIAQLVLPFLDGLWRKGSQGGP